MSRTLVKKGNIDRSDFTRAVLTDTVPEDLPIVVSNDGFHANLRRVDASPKLREIISALVTDNRTQRYTVPYRYRIRLSPTASRQLSLLHPCAQYELAKFYGDYAHLVPYFCRHDAVSLRRPAKVGSAISRRTSDSARKQFKGSAIDTLLQDQTVRNPGSFFAYGGYDRFYRFYNSAEFVDLERRFSVMRLTDISKCFSSIYSHTLAWAVKDVRHGKESVGARTFANSFDRVMQFSNYNETNGIPVGPEASRIFAEIILQSVDIKLLRQARLIGLLVGRDFEVRRYIDDYMIFSSSADVADSIQRALEEALGSFNLHINDGKTYTVVRPLQTTRSRVIARLDGVIIRFNERVVTILDDQRRSTIPNGVRNVAAVVGSLITEVKAACSDNKSGYEEVSPYLVGAIANVVERIITSQKAAGLVAEQARSNYLPALQTLFEAMYFFLTVHMTVRASYQVAKTTILALRFVSDALPEALPYFQDVIRNQIHSILSDPALDAVTLSSYVPVETLNAMMALRDLIAPYRADVQTITRRVIRQETVDYFSIVSLLFFYEGSDSGVRDRIESRLRSSFLPTASPRQVSHDAHLMLDLITCPYLTGNFRVQVLQALHRELSVPLGTLLEQQALIEEMQANPWFVNWGEIDLLNHLRKKELSSVY